MTDIENLVPEILAKSHAGKIAWEVLGDSFFAKITDDSGLMLSRNFV
jgi:hypothetical protein